jgi:hypothetical protein
MSISTRPVLSRSSRLSHPPVALVAAPEAARHDGVGKGEERRPVTALVAEPVDVELEFLVQHALQPAGRDVPVGLAVHGVADRHVVGRHGLGDRAGRPADPEEPADDLLAGPDLGDRAVPARVKVDAQRLVAGVGVVGASDELGHRSPCLLTRFVMISLRPAPYRRFLTWQTGTVRQTGK